MPTCGCSPFAGSLGLAGLPRSCLPPILRPPSAEAPCSPGLRPCTRGGLVHPSARGSYGASLAPFTPPTKGLVTAWACARLWRLRRLTSRSPSAGRLGVPPGGGAPGGTGISGPGQGDPICRQTWCRVSSLCFRATRAALFSSVAFHSSNAHWLRSAACPAAQVAATLPSSGVSTRSPPSPCGAGPAYPSPGGSGSVVGRPGSPLASRAWPSIRQASQWQPSSWGSTADLCRPHLVNLSSRTAHSYSAQGHSCIRSWGPSRLQVRASWAAGAALLAVLPATGPTLVGRRATPSFGYSSLVATVPSPISRWWPLLTVRGLCPGLPSTSDRPYPLSFF